MPDNAHWIKVGTGSVSDLGLLPVRSTTASPQCLAHGNLLLAAGLPDREDFTVGGYAATHVPRILQMPLRSPAVGDVLVEGALALIESLES